MLWKGKDRVFWEYSKDFLKGLRKIFLRKWCLRWGMNVKVKWVKWMSESVYVCVCVVGGGD